MRNYILGGASRSGKSSTAITLCEQIGINWYPLDPIICAIQETLPETGITYQRRSDAEIAQRLSPFFWELVKKIQGSSKRTFYRALGIRKGFVIDTCFVLPSEAKAFESRDLVIAFFGYPGLSAEQKLEQIRQNETMDDWTNKQDDGTLLHSLRQWILDSRYYQEQCKELGLLFFDTSESFDQVLEYAVDTMVNMP